MVVLWLVVNESGEPQDMKIIRSLQPELDKAAIEAVTKWRFKPATLNGKAIKVQINVEVNFRAN